MIIIDRKLKRKISDKDWTDAFGTEEAKREKTRTIEIPKGSKNPIHVAISSMGVKSLIGRQAFCFNDRKEMVNSVIADVIPPDFIHLKNKGVFRFADCVSIGG